MRNQASHSVGILQSNGLIQTDKLGWNIITVDGINIYEESLAPSVISSKKHERKMILKTLRVIQSKYIWMET